VHSLPLAQALPFGFVDTQLPPVQENPAVQSAPEAQVLGHPNDVPLQR
jgi:hypothetical protein